MSVCDHCIQNCLFLGNLSFLFLLGSQLLLYIFSILSHSIEIGYLACELVIQIRKLLLLDLLNGALEYCRLACQLGCMIILREGYVYFGLLVQFSTNQCLFKTGNEGTGTEIGRASCRERV